MTTVQDALEMALAARRVARREGLTWDRFLVRLSGYKFVRKLGEWVSRWTGKAVKMGTVLDRVRTYHEQVIGKNLTRLTERLISGQLSLPDWQERVALELRQGRQVLTVFGRGGREAVTYADWGRMGARLKQDYKRIDLLAQQVANGEISEAQMRNQLRQIADSVVSSWHDAERQAKKESEKYTEERRVLSPVEHCVDCEGYAAEGWQPLGYFPPPTIGSRCDGNCACSMEFK